ncbi:MAG: hypothetical protein M1812_004551, partial [Candelaria pacifica]
PNEDAHHHGFPVGFRRGDTLWIGASENLGNSKYPTNTLMQFYVIYVQDLTRWDNLDDYAKDHKDELVALQATLNLCLRTYKTSVTLGVTKTTETSRETNLDWQYETAYMDDGEHTEFPTVMTKHDSEEFWMSISMIQSIRSFLSHDIFTGTASMKHKTPGLGSVNTTGNDIVDVIAKSVYDDHAGIEGLHGLLDNLAIRMTNALRTTSDRPATSIGISSSVEPTEQDPGLEILSTGIFIGSEYGTAKRHGRNQAASGNGGSSEKSQRTAGG